MLELSVAERILHELQKWAAWIWSGESAVGVVLCGYLWRIINRARTEVAWKNLNEDDLFLRRLLFHERLTITSGVFLAFLIVVGMTSTFLTANVWVGIATLVVLLAVPAFIVWLVYMTIRMRLMEHR